MVSRGCGRRSLSDQSRPRGSGAAVEASVPRRAAHLRARRAESPWFPRSDAVEAVRESGRRRLLNVGADVMERRGSVTTMTTIENVCRREDLFDVLLTNGPLTAGEIAARLSISDWTAWAGARLAMQDGFLDRDEFGRYAPW